MKIKTLKAAFPHTIPILAGFLFLGMSYGFLMSSKGFHFIYPMLMSLLIFAGSMEFVTISLLFMDFNPLSAFILAFIVNARHLFYGISMLEKFKGVGLKKIYLIFGLCDESFTINYNVSPPYDVDSSLFMFYITILNHIYWVTGATLGGILGGFVSFNTKGLEFVMTSLFIVIFINQWKESKSKLPSVIGLLFSLVSLIIFGSNNFMIPSMVLIVLGLLTKRSYLEKEGE